MHDLPAWLDLLLSALVIAGALFALVGTIGLVRLRDVMQRLHGPTKATTLGVGCALIASSAYFSVANGRLQAHELLITLFLFLTAPVSAHLLARAALSTGAATAPTGRTDADRAAGVADGAGAAGTEGPRAGRGSGGGEDAVEPQR